MAVLTGDEVWADFREDGSINEPLLQNIRVWSRYIEQLATASGFKTYTTKAAMDADTSQPNGTPALIFSDPTAANNFPTVWVWNSGSSLWVAGTDRISSLQTTVSNIPNLFGDPLGLGDGATTRAGTLIFSSGETIIRLTTANTFNDYDYPAVDALAPGASVSVTLSRRSDAAGANNASVSLIWLDSAGVEISRATNTGVTSANVKEGVTVTGTVPGTCVTVRLRISKATNGTFADFWPATIRLYSATIPTQSFLPRQARRQLFAWADTYKQAEWVRDTWREPNGRALSLEDGPFTSAGILYAWTADGVESAVGRATAWWNQKRTMKANLVGTAGAGDRRGWLVGRSPASYAWPNAAGAQTGVLVYSTVLPPAAGAIAPFHSFTSTGIARFSEDSTILGGCFAIANDGRSYEGVSDYAAGIVFTSPDADTSLKEVPIHGFYPGMNSVQGLAIKYAANVPSLGVIDYSNKYLRRLSITFTAPSVSPTFDITLAPIPAEEIDLDALFTTYFGVAAGTSQPNGLAYDPTSNSWWVTTGIDAGGGLAYIAKVDAATKAVTKAWKITNAVDHLCFDPTSGYLFYTFGSTGTKAAWVAINPDTGAPVAGFTNNPLLDTTEGITIWTSPDGTVNVAAVGDGGFHTAASPALDLFCQYKLPNGLPPKIDVSKLLVSMVLRRKAAPTTRRYALSNGSMLSSQLGWGISIPANQAAQISFQCNTYGDAAVKTVDFSTVAGNETGFHVYSFLIDLDADLASAWRDNVALSAAAGSTTDLSGVSQRLQVDKIMLMGLFADTTRSLDSNTDLAAVVIADGSTASRTAIEAELDLVMRGLRY